jgi:hypothetical protein
MSSIEEAFKAKIVSLATAAGSNVFREAIEQEPDMPAIAFTRTGGPPMQRILETSVPALQRATMRVSVIADSVASADSVATALRTGLDGWRGTSLGVQVLRCACTFAHGDNSYVDGDVALRIVEQDYELTYR